MEVSYEAQTTVLGIQGMNMGTYTVFERIAGQATEPLRAAEVVRLTRAWPQ